LRPSPAVRERGGGEGQQFKLRSVGKQNLRPSPPAPLPLRGRGELTTGISNTVGFLPSPAVRERGGGEGKQFKLRSVGKQNLRPSPPSPSPTGRERGVHTEACKGIH